VFLANFHGLAPEEGCGFLRGRAEFARGGHVDGLVEHEDGNDDFEDVLVHGSPDLLADFLSEQRACCGDGDSPEEGFERHFSNPNVEVRFHPHSDPENYFLHATRIKLKLIQVFFALYSKAFAQKIKYIEF
jgi:hypothetical protein